MKLKIMLKNGFKLLDEVRSIVVKEDVEYLAISEPSGADMEHNVISFMTGNGVITSYLNYITGKSPLDVVMQDVTPSRLENVILTGFITAVSTYTDNLVKDKFINEKIHFHGGICKVINITFKNGDSQEIYTDYDVYCLNDNTGKTFDKYSMVDDKEFILRVLGDDTHKVIDDAKGITRAV